MLLSGNCGFEEAKGTATRQWLSSPSRHLEGQTDTVFQSISMRRELYRKQKGELLNILSGRRFDINNVLCNSMVEPIFDVLVKGCDDETELLASLHSLELWKSRYSSCVGIG